MYIQQGYARLWRNGEVIRLDDFADEIDSESPTNDLWLLIDRMSVDDSKDAISRLTDSVETAMYEGNGICRLVFLPSNICYDFSTRYEADGMTFEEPNDNMFSFNSPVGACPECE